MSQMPKKPQLKRTVFTSLDYYLMLRRDWIAANELDRRHFLHSICPELSEERIESAISLTAEESARHWDYQRDDSTVSPLDYLHRYWRRVPPEKRLEFLCEMLTPNERRALQYGFDEHEE